LQPRWAGLPAAAAGWAALLAPAACLRPACWPAAAAAARSLGRVGRWATPAAAARLLALAPRPRRGPACRARVPSRSRLPRRARVCVAGPAPRPRWASPACWAASDHVGCE